VDFSVIQAQNVWIRTLYDKHRFVMRGNLGWIETETSSAFRRICASSPGATAAFVGISTNRSHLRTKRPADRCLKTGDRIAGVSVQRQRKVVGRHVC
jgi:hypothetical protein